jgi:hemoglobin-like flavoprotein
MLEIGVIFAFIGRQLGRVLTLAFNWATTLLFGRVPQDRQLYLSGMALTALLWPIVLAGIAVPSFATFLLGLFTVPDWLDTWVRLAMLVLAIVLPLANGALSARLPDEAKRPKGRALATTILRGYPNSLALFVVLVWMMVVAPLGQIRALFKRWESAHVPIAVKPGGYDIVVRDLTVALDRAGIQVTRQPAHWAYELPGRVLALLGGETVRALVPAQLAELVGDGFEMTLHPMDLSLLGRKKTLSHARAAIVRELTFTEANQTWSKEAQALEDRVIKAARGEDDLDAIGAELNERDFDFEEWEILYRLLLQVRLRVSGTGTDALDTAHEPKPALRERVAAAARVLAGRSNGH